MDPSLADRVIDGTALERCRQPKMTACQLDLGARVERVHIAGEGAKRCQQMAGCRIQATARQLEFPELGFRPGERLGLVGGCIAGEQECAAGCVERSEQLARVGDAGIRRDARLQARHRVERGEGLLVAPQLELRIADDAVVACRGRRDLQRTPAELERQRKAVPGERERRKAARRVEVVRRELDSTREHPVRLDVVRRVAGLARPLLVGEAEQVEAADVLRPAAQAGL